MPEAWPETLRKSRYCNARRTSTGARHADRSKARSSYRWLNPYHPLVGALKHESDEKRFADWSHILLDQAVLAEDGELDESGAFVKRLNELMLSLAGTRSRIWTPGG
jgi:HSP90 family molecular chaperone